MSKPCPVRGVAIYADCLECESKACKVKARMYNKVVVGIDQSYKNTGVSVFADGERKVMRGINLNHYTCNTVKREVLKNDLNGLFEAVKGKSNDVTCNIERIRLNSAGFTSIDYIKSIGALNCVIVDIASKHGITVSSIDTRCWKSQVVGTSKPEANRYGVDPKKWPTVKWCLQNGWEQYIIKEITNKQKKKGVFERNGKRWMYDDDIADSAGLSLFGFVGDPSKMKEEK